MQDNLHAHAHNAAILISPQIGDRKPYLEVFSRFGLWRDFPNDNIQATISAFRLIKNMSINPISVEFHQCHAKPHSNCFFFCQDLLTIENTNSYEKNVWEKSNDAYSLSIRVQTTINHNSIFTLLCFYDNIKVKENVFIQSSAS